MESSALPITIATGEDGLVLRRAVPADTDALATFHAAVLAEGDDASDPMIEGWVRELMSGAHPTFAPGDFTIVETAAGEIVSSLGLISQTWMYGGIPIRVGRVELVSTREDFRRRGLVRRQMGFVHALSAERGEVLQGITGIPHFYRQFGYEMALEIGGGRRLNIAGVPTLDADAVEPFSLRPATAEDAAMLAGLEDDGRRRWLITAVRNADHWRYEIETAMDPRYAMSVVMIVNARGETVGCLTHYGELHDGRMIITTCELVAGLSWLAVLPSLLRGLVTRGEALATAHDSGPVRALSFGLGGDHPLYQMLPERNLQVSTSYAWYVRVADLPAFLRQVAPVLERRLAESAACGHSGELLLNFYTSGLRLVFDNGRLTTIEEWAPPDSDSGGASFPGLSFLQLVVGYRSLAELRHAFADCQVNSDEARVLLEILLPRLPSQVWPID